uniref:MIB/HERC2 domain-containing protein n=1 Tax=Macrostomum lignano TaxID=282301 RepID=A0A1I8FM77_9PLAT
WASAVGCSAGPTGNGPNRNGGEGSVGTVRNFESPEEVVAPMTCASLTTGQLALYTRTVSAATSAAPGRCMASDGPAPIATAYPCAQPAIHGDKHSTRHRFFQFVHPLAEPVWCDSRRRAKKYTCRGLFPGARVVRGVDWQWGGSGRRQWEAGQGHRGAGLVPGCAESAAYVLWDSGVKNLYRVGYEAWLTCEWCPSAKSIRLIIETIMPLLASSTSASLELAAAPALSWTPCPHMELCAFQPGDAGFASAVSTDTLQTAVQRTHAAGPGHVRKPSTLSALSLAWTKTATAVVSYPSGNRSVDAEPAALCLIPDPSSFRRRLRAAVGGARAAEEAARNGGATVPFTLRPAAVTPNLPAVGAAGAVARRFGRECWRRTSQRLRPAAAVAGQRSGRVGRVVPSAPPMETF